MGKKSKKSYINTSSVTSSVGKAGVAASDDFNPDYSYVIKDLKRIGVLALTFFAILIVLSFVL